MRAEGQPGMGSSRAMVSLVIAGRLILLLLAGLATVWAFVLPRGGDQRASGVAERYACPMHPEVVSLGPDECPVCRMALERVHTSGHTRPGPASAPEASLAEAAYPTVLATARRRVLTLEVRAPAWVESPRRVAAVLYKDEAAGLLADERGLFFRAAEPSAGIAVRPTGEPPAPWGESTSRVRFRLDPGAPGVPQGEVGWIELAARPGERLVIPAAAVLYSSQGPHVLVPGRDSGAFSRQRVGIGRVDRGLAVVLSGLREGEPVAAANTFFLDAERRLQSLRQEPSGTQARGGAP